MQAIDATVSSGATAEVVRRLSPRFEKYTVALGIVGAAVLFGLYWLVGGWFRGLFAGAGLIATGGVVVALVLDRMNLVPSERVRNVVAAGIPLGLACAGTTVLSLVTQGRLWVI